MRYSCEEGYDYAEGYSVGEEDKGGVGGVGVVLVKRMIWGGEEGSKGEVLVGRGGRLSRLRCCEERISGSLVGWLGKY